MKRTMKRVRILLRVSSGQQLEADGDLGVQRQLVTEYVRKHSDWRLDEKEYFEGSISGYCNSVEERDVLKRALEDASSGEYDILVAYKDDRIGRRMWEIGTYVMALKEYGVDIYTVTDGCISPESDDIMGQMMLALRYGNAQKSSSDTGKRVKDTAQELILRGKFMGGRAPYGYCLQLSGEISKHGRVLQHLVIVKDQAEVVQYIYELSLQKEYGSMRIAKTLNKELRYRQLAPSGIWKSSTITSILTNPVYKGYLSYKRREKKNGKICRQDSSQWLLAREQNPDLQIIDRKVWDQVQEKRKQRAEQYGKKKHGEIPGGKKEKCEILSLIHVLYCGYCGAKMTNGTRYYYRKKDDGEYYSIRKPAYKCLGCCQGAIHEKKSFLWADQIEPMIRNVLEICVKSFLTKEEILRKWKEEEQRQIEKVEKEMKREKQSLKRIQERIAVMEENIPDTMKGKESLELMELMNLLRKERDKEKTERKKIQELENKRFDKRTYTAEPPSLEELLRQSDTPVIQRIVDKLIKKIEIKDTQIYIFFQIKFRY